MKPFAKLFDTPSGPFLVTTSAADDVPCLVFRVADRHALITEVVLEAEAADEQGVEQIFTIFTDFDQEQANAQAALLTKMIDDLIENAAETMDKSTAAALDKMMGGDAND